MTSETVTRRYTLKLYPSKSQSATMQRQAALLATLWNAALEQREAQWAQECQRKAKADRKGLSFYDQSKDVKFIRADDPEFAAMSADTPPLCLKALDDAFKAFFRRAKSGAGAASGYPKYKSPYAIENKGADCTIWHRDQPKGWRIARSGKHYRVYAQGLCDLKDKSTWIKARGRFPVDFDDLVVRDMRLIRTSGVWHCSIVVKMEPRMMRGQSPLSVEFDLIDEFVRVTNRTNGECLPGWDADFPSADERIHSGNPEVNRRSAAEASENGAEGRCTRTNRQYSSAAEALENGADGRVGESLVSLVQAAGASENGADGRESPSKAIRDKADEASENGGSGRIKRINHDDHYFADAIQSERDTRYKKFSCRWKREKRRIARMKAKEARQRKERLHRLTTEIIRNACEVEVICPPIKEATKSARGNEKFHGAAVKPVAMLNRHILSQAPSAAIAMLEYKAEEAGIPFAWVKPTEHAVDIGRDLPTATKAVRKARRSLKEEAA